MEKLLFEVIVTPIIMEIKKKGFQIVLQTKFEVSLSSVLLQCCNRCYNFKKCV